MLLTLERPKTAYQRERAYYEAENARLKRHSRRAWRLALARLIAGRKGVGHRKTRQS